MGQTTANLDNINKPAPRWYRKAKRVINLLSGPTVLTVFKVFNLSDSQVANVATIIMFLPTVLEIFNAILANGEEYSKTEA